MDTHRVQMDLTTKSYERLKNLKEISEAGSYTEVMKDALRLYEFFITKDAEGARFLIEESGKPQTEIKLFT